MKKVEPIFSPQPYDAATQIRIVNPTQIAAYWANGCTPKDVYVTRDFSTNRPTIVAIFDREETKEYFDKWCKHELT